MCYDINEDKDSEIEEIWSDCIEIEEQWSDCLENMVNNQPEKFLQTSLNFIKKLLENM